MPDDTESLLRRLIGGDPAAPAEVVARAATSSTPALLVAAALLTDRDGDRAESDRLVVRAGARATTTRDRQLVAIATAHLARDDDLFDALVRDHLADHPDNLLAAWIAAGHATPDLTRPDPTTC